MKIELLDHGYIELVETWGSDERIIEAARMSTNKGFQGWTAIHSEKCHEHSAPGMKEGNLVSCICEGGPKKPGDEKLLRFLWENKHATPFEMAGMVIEVQAPIFVFREWHRHRTQSYNELSARYTALPDLFYVPSIERIMAGKQSKANKQGSEGGFTQLEAEEFQAVLCNSYQGCRTRYEAMLKTGLARELARLVIPVAQYSRMRASANLRNWLAFLTLRMASGAQWEIRQYANAVGQIVEKQFSRTWELFKEKQ